MNTDRYFEELHKGLCENGGCGGQLLLAAIIALFLVCGCRTVKESEYVKENKSYVELTNKIDSMNRQTSVYLQDLMAKQTSLVDSFRQSQKRDSTHVVVVNEKGDTVRERIVIYKEVQTDHSKQKEEKEYWMRMFKRNDSVLSVIIDRQARTDSLLRERDKVSEKQLSKWQRMKVEYGGWAMAMLVLTIVLSVTKSGLFGRIIKRKR